MVQLYTLSTCPWCKKVKNLLNEKGVSYDCVDLDIASEEEKEKALKEVDKLSNERKFPITVINESVIIGFKQEEIEEALGK